jgi:ferredoxin
LKGFLTADLIRQEAGDLAGRTCFVVGPRAMYDFCLGELALIGVPGRRIRREAFGPPEDVTRMAGWPEGIAADTTFRVEVAGHPPVLARAGEPLLSSMERHGVVVPAVCRSGECSACRTRLVSGRVFLPPFHGVRDWDREHGYIHPCMTYPIDDLALAL